MSDRQKIIDELGSILEQAARSSVAKGAHYDPGEQINLDSKGAWTAVASMLVTMVEAMMAREGKLEPSHDDVP